MNDTPYIMMLVMALSINYFAIDFEKEVEAKEVELIEMKSTLAYVFTEGMETTDRLNQCMKRKKK